MNGKRVAIRLGMDGMRFSSPEGRNTAWEGRIMRYFVELAMYSFIFAFFRNHSQEYLR